MKKYLIVALRFLKVFFVGAILSIVFSLGRLTYGMEHYNELWTKGTIIGSFSKNYPFKYYLESEVRFIDDAYKFHKLFFLPGLGYSFTPNLTLFVGPGWTLNKSTQGEINHEYQLWEQLIGVIPIINGININSRTRFEQKVKSDAPGMAVVLRERIWVRVPFQHSPKYYFSTFDEVFFNINHPTWVSIDTFSENRAFIGIGMHLSKTVMLDIGYLNQYIMASKYQDNNVLLINFNINN